jgi:UDP-N-acetylmuramyl pentapeptide phosphotransferase/UDP-N-acetylglucosamine-1-phosphate transferase
MVNTVNFMDGANGMAMGCSGIGLLGLAGLLVLMPVAGPQSYHLASLGVIGFGACCGFLVWNAGLGRVFSGDVGALFVGLLCGTLGVLAVRVGANPFSVVLCFLPMLIDVILTIILRLSRGENVLQAHAKHGYQLSIRNGASHLATSSYYWFLTAGCALIAIVSQIVGGGAPFGGFALYLFILCVLYFYRLHKIPAGNRTDDLD